MAWYKIEIDAAKVQAGELSDITNQFENHLRLADYEDEMALFLVKPECESSDLATKLYFTPSAARKAINILIKYQGKECKKPEKTLLTLLVGATKVWDNLFKSEN